MKLWRIENPYIHLRRYNISAETGGSGDAQRHDQPVGRQNIGGGVNPRGR